MLINVCRLDAILKGKLTNTGTQVNNRAVLVLNPRTEEERRRSLDLNEIQDIFNKDLKDKIKFQINTGYAQFPSNLPGGIFENRGLTTKGMWEEHALITLAVEILEPLLRDDLTDAER